MSQHHPVFCVIDDVQVSIRHPFAKDLAVMRGKVAIVGRPENPRWNADRRIRLRQPRQRPFVTGAHPHDKLARLALVERDLRPVVVFPLAISDSVPTIGITEPLRMISLPAYAPGEFLYVSRDGIDDVQLDLRLFNVADRRSNWGTKLPVVREREFDDSVSLINVPTAADFRSALRTYGLPDETLIGETVIVKIYSHDDRLLASTEMVFDGPRFEGTPRYVAFLSLADAFPEIRQVDRVRVSVTSNTTQDVSIVTPH